MRYDALGRVAFRSEAENDGREGGGGELKRVTEKKL